jgi:hypothetical protein
MPDRLTDAYLAECEQRARRFQGAWTGTSGDLAARLMHCIAEVRRLASELAVERARRVDS